MRVSRKEVSAKLHVHVLYITLHQGNKQLQISMAYDRKAQFSFLLHD